MSNSIEHISSSKGFYIGDICYVLDKALYRELWGVKHGYQDGCFQDPKTELWFSVQGTAYGDGCYEDQYGNTYDVDAGVIGLVPLELVAVADPEIYGTVIRIPGIAHFAASDGLFRIAVPNGKVYVIDTHYHYVDDEPDEDMD